MIDRMICRFQGFPAWKQRIILDLVVVLWALGTMGWHLAMGGNGGTITFGILMGLMLRFMMKRTWTRPRDPARK